MRYLRYLGGTPFPIATIGTHPLTYGTDGLGSVTANTDGSGALANSYARDAWGETLQVSGQTYQPLFFAGVYDDHETNLYQIGGEVLPSRAGALNAAGPEAEIDDGGDSVVVRRLQPDEQARSDGVVGGVHAQPAVRLCDHGVAVVSR